MKSSKKSKLEKILCTAVAFMLALSVLPFVQPSLAQADEQVCEAPLESDEETIGDLPDVDQEESAALSEEPNEPSDELQAPEQALEQSPTGNLDAQQSGTVTPLAETVVLIENAAQLIDLLNRQKVDAGTKYILAGDITIQASLLEEQYFTGSHTLNDKANWLSSFDGAGYTITVEVDPGAISRPLFYHINYSASTPNLPVTFENFTVRYTGDVSGAGLSLGICYDVTFKNISIVVGDAGGTRHDIVSRENLSLAPGAYTASGFAFQLNTQLSTSAALTQVKDITVIAGTIGSKKNTPEDQAVYNNDVSGFAGLLDNYLQVQNITIDVQDIYSMNAPDTSLSRTQAKVSGFVRSIHIETGACEGIAIKVANNIECYNLSHNYHGFGYDGVYGFFLNGSTLKNSTLTVGGDMITRTGSNGGSSLNSDKACVTLMGSTLWSNSVPAAPQFDGNTVVVAGSVKALGRGDCQINLGMINSLSSYPVSGMANNTVTIKGNVIAQRSGDPLVEGAPSTSSYMVGINYGMYKGSKNDHLTIGGDVIIEQDRTDVASSAGAYLHSYGNSINSLTPMSVEGGSVTVGGDVSITAASGSSLFFGFNYGRSFLLKNNKATYLGNVTCTSGGTATSSYSYASGFMYSDGGTNDGATERLINNNTLYIAGDLKALAENEAYASGFAVTLSSIAGVEDNVVRIDGKLEATTNNPASADGCLAGGFALQASGQLTHNALYVRDGIFATAASPTTSTLGSFLVYALPDATISENTVLGRPGIRGIGDPVKYYERLVAEVDPAANVGNNFFTSILQGQRVTNLLTFDAVAGIFTADADKQPLLTVTDTTDFSDTAPYITSNAYGNLALVGLDAEATKAALTPTGAETYDMWMSSTTLTPMLTAQVSGLRAVLDLPDIGYQYPVTTMNGLAFVDQNDSGTHDPGDPPVAGAAIQAKLGLTTIATATTDVNGSYSMNMPLLSCVDPTLTLEIAAQSSTYALSPLPYNDFTQTGSTTKAMNYVENFTLNGMFSPLSTLEVIFDTQGGSAVPPLTGILAGSTIVEPATVPTKPGHLFAGWYKDREGTTPWAFATDTVSANTTLYAKWNQQGGGGTNGDSTKTKAGTFPVTGDGNTLLLVIALAFVVLSLAALIRGIRMHAQSGKE